MFFFALKHVKLLTCRVQQRSCFHINAHQLPLRLAVCLAHGHEEVHRFSDLLKIRACERILMQMLQHPPVSILQGRIHRRLKEIVRDQTADQGGFGIRVLHHACPPKSFHTTGMIIPQNLVSGYSQNDEIYDARPRGKEKS